MTDEYLSIATPSQGLYKEKGSKFLAFAYPITSADEAKEHIERLKKQYFDARHHCYAYILGADKSTYRLNDDGEPSGTGGRPIHGQLLSKDVSDTLVVVVRYFGGVLLGASGLANAYKTAARDALDNATLVTKLVEKRLLLLFEYPQMNEVMRVLKELGIAPRRQQFDMSCSLEVAVRLSQIERFYEAFRLKKVEVREP